MGVLKIFPATALVSLASTLSAQAPPPPPGPGPPPTWNATPPSARSSRFEVATIKRSTSLSPFGSLQPAAGRLTIANMTLEAMIKAAYGDQGGIRQECYRRGPARVGAVGTL